MSMEVCRRATLLISSSPFIFQGAGGTSDYSYRYPRQRKHDRDLCRRHSEGRASPGCGEAPAFLHSLAHGVGDLRASWLQALHRHCHGQLIRECDSAGDGYVINHVLACR
jgi:hypothetical protein